MSNEVGMKMLGEAKEKVDKMELEDLRPFCKAIMGMLVNPGDEVSKQAIQDLTGEGGKAFAVLGLSMLMFQMNRQDEKIEELKNPLGEFDPNDFPGRPG